MSTHGEAQFDRTQLDRIEVDRSFVSDTPGSHEPQPAWKQDPWGPSWPCWIAVPDPRWALCERCCHIDFRWLLDANLRCDIKIGTFDEIRGRKDCPSCRLVVDTLLVHVAASRMPIYGSTMCSVGSMEKRVDRGPMLTVNWHGDRFAPSANLYELEAEGGYSLPTCRARYRMTLIPTSFKPSTARGWLADCARNHGSSGSLPYTVPRPKSLRLVDVWRQCLVEAPPDARYLALSYRWGQTELFPTTEANISDRMKKDGVHMDDARIPRTIRDAMAVTLQLRERFLWVDSICIIQDSESDREEQINQMASIYGRYHRISILIQCCC